MPRTSPPPGWRTVEYNDHYLPDVGRHSRSVSSPAMKKLRQRARAGLVTILAVAGRDGVLRWRFRRP